MKSFLSALIIIGILTATASGVVVFDWQEVTGPGPVGGGSVPTGYLCYDLMMTVDSNISQVQMYITDASPAAGDIYQDPNVGGVPGQWKPADVDVIANPSLEFDTYINLPVSGSIIGAAINVVAGARAYTFDDQLLDIAWGVNGGETSAQGTFQVARVTVADDYTGSWDIWAQETGTIPIPEYTASGTFPLVSFRSADFDEDGDVDAFDFADWQANYPTASGATHAMGDADGDGDVDAFDFADWQADYPYPPAPEPASEPTTIMLLSLAGLAVLRGKRP